MHIHPSFLLIMGVIFLLAWLAKRCENRFVLPAPVGKISMVVWLMFFAVGFSFVLLGLERVDFFKESIHALRGTDAHHMSVFGYMAEAGACLIMLKAGLESDLKKLFASAKIALWIALIGIVAPQSVACAYGMFVLGMDFGEAFFFGGVFAATSVGISQSVMESLGVASSGFARIIQAAAVVDDVGGLIDLTVATAINAEDASVGAVVQKVGMALAGAVGLPIVGHFVAPRLQRVLRTWDEDVQEYAIYAVTCLFVAVALSFGIAGILGAFFTGLGLDPLYFHPDGETDHDHDPVEHALTRLVMFFAPFFFVGAVCSVDPMLLMSYDVVVHGSILSVLMVLAKMASGIVAPADKLIIGTGMAPRGEVGIIFSKLGLAEGILSPLGFAISMSVVLLSTLIGSMLIGPVIAWSHRNSKGDSSPQEAA